MAGPGWVGNTIGRQHVRLGTLASLLGIPCKELDLQIRTTIHGES
jgi:hypothetical protein